MTVSYSPQAIWGRELRYYRKRAGLTQAQLAARINFAESLISGCENGNLAASPEFAEACDEALDTGGALVRLLDYRKAEVFPAWFGEWPIIESKAARMRNFQLEVVPGLLQTEPYASVLLNGDKQKIAARLERQQVLFRADPAPPKLRVILDEAVLLRPVGDKAVMREQLEYLIEVAAHEDISVQVIPYGVHPGLPGGFVIASLGAGNGEVAYVEAAVRGHIARNPADIEAFDDLWESLHTYALPQRESLELIKKTVEERWTLPAPSGARAAAAAPTAPNAWRWPPGAGAAAAANTATAWRSPRCPASWPYGTLKTPTAPRSPSPTPPGAPSPQPSNTADI